MAVEVALREVGDASMPNRQINAERIAEEIKLLPFEGRSFTSVAVARDEIAKLGALFSKTGVDSVERVAAEESMRRLIGQLAQDEDVDDLDDEPLRSSVAAKTDAASNVSRAKGEVTQPQAKLTPDRRVDLLLEIAENSPIPYSRLEAIDAVDRLTSQRGATEEQRGTLRRIQENGPENVQESAGEIYMKLVREFHTPMPKTGNGKLLKEEKA